MRYALHVLTILSFTIVLGITTGVFAADAESGDYTDAPWLEPLTNQLAAERGCTLKLISRVKEFHLAGEPVVEGRAHCEDGRNFEFARRKKHQVFEFKICEPTYC